MNMIEFASSADGTNQGALFYAPAKAKRQPVPLVVGFHQWSFDLTEPTNGPACFKECKKRGWAFVYPNFRGPNSRPEACASPLAQQDVLDAVEYAKRNALIDEDRLYLVGASGGGMMTLFMAGKYPRLWAAASAWVPILSLRQWHRDGKQRGNKYPGMLERCCGGAPGTSKAADAQYRLRSPGTYLKNAAGLSLDLNAGIHDGHAGSVPVSHTLKAFNLLVKAAGLAGKLIAPAEIKTMTDRELVPANLRYRGKEPFTRMHDVLFRRTAGKTRVTIFEGGHDIDPAAAFRFFEGKKRFKNNG